MGRIIKFKKSGRRKKFSPKTKGQEYLPRTFRWKASYGFLSLLAVYYLAAIYTQEMSGEETIVEGIHFQNCGGGEYQQNCVIDGDTIYYGSVKIRIADIDTPEIFSPKCNDEYNLGMRAKHRMQELLNEGSFVLETISGRDEDTYGRKLRTISRGGRSLGDILVDEGLARPWLGSRLSWC